MTDNKPGRAECPMPSTEDAERTELLINRESLLDDDAQDVGRKYLIAKAGEDKAAIIGAMDTSCSPLSSICRQLTTPGLYGRQPRITHRDPAVALLTEQIALAGWLTKMPRVQYLAVGLGEYLLRLDVPRELGHLTVRTVSPVDVFVECDPDQPDVPIRLWERRVRRDPSKKWAWFWDCYDIGQRGPRAADGTPGEWVRPPSYCVVRRTPQGDEDFSAFFLNSAPGGFVGVEGDNAYPFCSDEIAPFLPWAVYRCVDTGRMWNHNEKRGLTLGTLNAMTYATYAGHSALGATGRTVIGIGVDFGASVQEAPKDQQATSKPRTIQLMPGTFLSVAPMPNVNNPQLVEVGPGADLGVLQSFAHGYELEQAVRAGLNPSDATRTGANPTSGSALAISDKGRREYADQVRPHFQRVDAEVIRKIAWLMRITGLGAPPTDGYTIEYHTIPDSPDEQRARREARDAAIARGELSQVDAYMTDHPGLTREQAENELVAVALDTKRLAKRITAESVAAGLESTDSRADKQALVGIVDISRQILVDAAMGRETKRVALTVLGGLDQKAADALIATLPPDPEIADANEVEPATVAADGAEDATEPADPAAA